MQLLYTISYAVFLWLKVFVPVIFILKVAKLKPPALNMQILVISINWALLLAALLFLFSIIISFFVAYYSGVDYVQYALINRATGPYWFIFWTPVFTHVVLPQIMWFKKVRNGVTGIYLWFVLSTLEFYYSWQMSLKVNFIPANPGAAGVIYQIFPPFSSLLYCLQTLLIFSVVIALFYFIILKKQKPYQPL